MNAFVPDLAIVPKQLIKSSRVMPIPLSRIVSVFASLSTLTCTFKLSSPSNTFLSSSD